MSKVKFVTTAGYTFGNAGDLPRVCVIGRSEQCNFRPDLNEVSRRHALLRVDDEGNLFVRDLSSKNGTFVNQERLPVFSEPAIGAGMPAAGTPIGNERLFRLDEDHLFLMGGDSAPQVVIEEYDEAGSEDGQGYLLKLVVPATFASAKK